MGLSALVYGCGGVAVFGERYVGRVLWIVMSGSFGLGLIWWELRMGLGSGLRKGGMKGRKGSALSDELGIG